jgi:hypothetical protein
MPLGRLVFCNRLAVTEWMVSPIIDSQEEMMGGDCVCVPATVNPQALTADGSSSGEMLKYDSQFWEALWNPSTCGGRSLRRSEQ